MDQCALRYERAALTRAARMQGVPGQRPPVVRATTHAAGAPDRKLQRWAILSICRLAKDVTAAERSRREPDPLVRHVHGPEGIRFSISLTASNSWSNASTTNSTFWK